MFAVDVAGRVLVATTITGVRSARRECLELTSGEHTLIVTPDHPIFAPAHAEFVEAGRIALAQVREVLLVDEPEATPRVAAVGACRTYAGLHEVFDLSVDGPHRTFVAEGFVVHNKSYLPGTTSEDPPQTSGLTTGTTDPIGTSTGPGLPTTGETTDASTGTTGGGTFACGDELLCELGAEYCESSSGGIDPTVSYRCQPIPAECTDNPTCVCLSELLAPQSCTGEPATGVTITFAFP